MEKRDDGMKRMNGENWAMIFRRRMFFLLLLMSISCCFGAEGTQAETLLKGDVSAQVFQKGGMAKVMPPVKSTSKAAKPEEEIRQVLFNGLDQCADEIDLQAYKLTLDDFKRLYAATLNSHPELFYVSGAFSYYGAGNYIVSVLPVYDYSGDTLTAMRKAYKDRVAQIASYAAAGTTPLLKCALVNDYFCTHFQYDTSYTIYDSYHLFVLGTGVCQAYMEGYIAVMNYLNIPVSYVVSSAMDHTWNLVQIDGNWYHVDVTWNDPLPDRAGKARHGYFMCSDDLFQNNEGFSNHYDWVSDQGIVCDSSAYDDAVWRSIDIPLAVQGDAFYAVSSQHWNCSLIRWQDQNISELYTFTAYWQSGSGIYGDYFGAAAVSGDQLLFTTADSVQSYDLKTGTVGIRYQAPAELGIWESTFDNGRWNYALGHDLGDVERRGALNVSELLRFRAQKDVLTDYDGTDTEVIIPDYLGVYTIGSDVFQGHEALKSVHLPDTVRVIRDDTFKGCTALTEINLSRALLSIGSDAFAGCSKLTATCYAGSYAEMYCAENGIPRKMLYGNVLTFPGSLRTVGDEAFSGSSAEEVTLPDGLLSIGSRAFSDCENLLIIRFPASVTEIAEDAFQSDERAVLYVPLDSCAMEFAMRNGFDYLVVNE